MTTGIDMALAMVEQDHDANVANKIAGHLVLYVRRPGFQSQWSEPLTAQRDRARSVRGHRASRASAFEKSRRAVARASGRHVDPHDASSLRRTSAYDASPVFVTFARRACAHVAHDVAL